jgi:hypothetical protein
MLAFAAIAEVALAEIPGGGQAFLATATLAGSGSITAFNTGTSAWQVSATLVGRGTVTAFVSPSKSRVRRTTGKMIVIDTEGGNIVYGSPVFKNEPFFLLVSFQETISGPISLKFTSPTGKVQDGDSDFAYVGMRDTPYLPIPFKAGQFVIYIADDNEFQESGTWTADIAVGNVTANSRAFNISLVN